MLRPGEPAPEFAGMDQNGELVSLRSIHGRPVVLYFYPEDGSPGCTAEACAFRDGMGALLRHGVEVVGVSTDSIESHARFAREHGLNFRLISDPERNIVRAFGVEGPSGRAERVTFLIGDDGFVRHVILRVSPEEHVSRVLERLVSGSMVPHVRWGVHPRL